MTEIVRPNLERTVAPSTLPLTVARAKKQCAIEDSETYWDDWFDDGVNDGAIYAARDLVEKDANVALTAQTYVWEIPSWEGLSQCLLELPVHPVSSISSIGYLDANDASQTLDSSYYDLKTSEYRSRLYNADSSLVFPNLSDKKPLPVTITMVVGFATVPNSARQALQLLVGHWWANREAVLVGTISKEIERGYWSLINVLRPKKYR